MESDKISQMRVDPIAHIKDGIAELFRHDYTRLYQILGIFQYTIVYGIICFYLGVGLESFFPDADESKNSWAITWEVLGQTFVLALALFYIRIFVKAIPAIPTLFMAKRSGTGRDFSTASYKFSEYQGELVVAIVFIGVQLNLLSKITILAKRVLNYFGLNKGVLRIHRSKAAVATSAGSDASPGN